MTPQGLMIGNWVKYKGVDVIWDIGDFGDDAACLLSEPIPLTEQWLIDFGFEKKQWVSAVWEKSGVILLKCDDGCLFLAGPLHVHIFYAHHLQNLYFALTGKELSK